MKIDGKNKAKATLIVMMLLLSMVVILTTLPTVGAAPTVIDVENNYSGICGEQIWINATGFGIQQYVWVNFSYDAAGTSWPDDYLKKARTDPFGDLNTTFYVPWRASTGQYVINLTQITNTSNTTECNFTITDIYKVETDPSTILWDDTEPQDFTISVYNWTGNTYTLLKKNIRYTFWEPDFGKAVVNNTMNIGTIETDAYFNWSSDGTLSGNREANYTLNITSFDAPFTVFASVWVPVRFDMRDLTPTTAVYGQDITFIGYLYDGGDDPVIGLEYVQILSPTKHTYYSPVTTTSKGKFTFGIDCNESGTWYVGTWVTGTGTRPTDTETTKGLADFISYGTLEVVSAEGTITVDPDETTYGFDIELEIYCEDANGDPIPDGAHVYVTGVETDIAGHTNIAKNYTELQTIDNPMGTVNGWLNVSLEDEFKFNESGTATFWLYYNGTYEYYEDHEDELPLVTASTHVDVESPGPMNVFVDYDAEAVQIDDMYTDVPAPWTDENNWWNLSFPLNVTVYGKTDATMMNASITVSGCGLDLEFEETEQPPDGYQYYISPRNGGVLTVTVTNGTKGYSIIEDVEIVGLVSNAVTSIGDNKEITVDTEEMITFTVDDAYWAEVHVNLFADDWTHIEELNMTEGDNTDGNGNDGIYEFMPDTSTLGHIVLAAMAGYGDNRFYTYDIVDIVPEHDLVIEITTPEAGNLTLTAGLEYDIIVDIYNLTGAEITVDTDWVIWELLDENNTEIEGQTGSFDYVSGNTWQIENKIFTEPGTLRITAAAFEGKHDGNNSDMSVGLAVFEYMPSGLSIGINLEDVGVDIIAYDAVGDLLTEEDFIMDQTDATDTTLAGNSSGTLYTDEYGETTIWFSSVGNEIGSFCALLGSEEVNTSGELEIDWPIFTVDPQIIYVGYMAEIYIKAEDPDGIPIKGVNLTLTPSVPAITGGAIPDPVATGEDGWVPEPISIEPSASGTLNVTIAYDIGYVNGQLNWTSLLTDTVVSVTAKKPMEISVSSYSVYEGDTLTVTVTSANIPLSGADVKFGQQTQQTGSDGTVDFVVPDPYSDSTTWTVIASKTGYITPTAIPITVMTVYDIVITTPTHVYAGETFTVTISAKGSVLVGVEVVLDNGAQTAKTDSNGRASFKAGSKGATHTITAEFGNYEPGSATVTVEEKKTPGFELLTLIIAIGVAFILLRRRRN
jgi:hypothetical protein